MKPLWWKRVQFISAICIRMFRPKTLLTLTLSNPSFSNIFQNTVVHSLFSFICPQNTAYVYYRASSHGYLKPVRKYRSANSAADTSCPAIRPDLSFLEAYSRKGWDFFVSFLTFYLAWNNYDRSCDLVQHEIIELSTTNLLRFGNIKYRIHFCFISILVYNDPSMCSIARKDSLGK